MTIGSKMKIGIIFGVLCNDNKNEVCQIRKFFKKILFFLSTNGTSILKINRKKKRYLGGKVDSSKKKMNFQKEIDEVITSRWSLVNKVNKDLLRNKTEIKPLYKNDFIISHY